MDLKAVGNLIYLVGLTHEELGGSHFALVRKLAGGAVPQVRPDQARAIFLAVSQAIQVGHVRACHDLSEGGLAVALAEMAFAGGLGASVRLPTVPHQLATASDAVLLFAESNSRFLCEVPSASAAEFETAMAHVPHAAIGQVEDTRRLRVEGLDAQPLIDESLESLKESWQQPLRF